MKQQAKKGFAREREWRSKLAIWVAGLLLFETAGGLLIWLLAFSVFSQVMVLLHTAVGLVFVVPAAIYVLRHWLLYRSQVLTHVTLLGYLGALALLLCAGSGIVLTVQAGVGSRIGYVWDSLHIITTLAILTLLLPHVSLVAKRSLAGGRHSPLTRAVAAYSSGAALSALVLTGLVALAWFAYVPVQLDNEFPPDYVFKYGRDRPFAPSLAQTESGGAFDDRSLSGSASCGTAACHEQIVSEWEGSAHRYAAMDLAFQKIQLTMAEQNGPESTRYCGGCHDPISLFSGTKNLYTDPAELTSLRGHQEGVSCLVCHGVRETDLKGNAHYVMTQPPRYMFELEYEQNKNRSVRFLRDFLIRAYPAMHVESLSKQLFKAPEYCAACHKQFIDEEINNVGWVQLQNQFDNWRMSRWNHPDDPARTIECRECHMPLVESSDPASGDASDYNRSAEDGRHRSHRFIGANQMMPALLQLPGWEEQVRLTEDWLAGRTEIPEIADKWAKGPAVALELVVPESVTPGASVSLRTIITSNKVGHDFPTGPLDIIQSWLELVVTDDGGQEIFSTGTVDESGFIASGSFILKAEPVDQYGNLIDRHNLWEMVGVRHRRALFPGFSDVADFRFFCPDVFPASRSGPSQPLVGERRHVLDVPPNGTRQLHVTARLKYRKVDQNLLNFLFGADAGLRSPITELAADKATIEVLESRF